MSYAIGKSFTFSASHQLAGLPDGHQCGRMHGHNYTVCLELAAPAVDDAGMVLDFGALADFRQYLDSNFDHRHLNDVIDDNPTAENLARVLYDVAVRLVPVTVDAVTVWETATCWASFRPR